MRSCSEVQWHSPFRSATSTIVETSSATLRQDVSSILTPLYACPAAFILEPLIVTISEPLGPGEGFILRSESENGSVHQ